MMIFQKNRGYELKIGDAKTGDGILVTDLQITFDINKSSSNKAKRNSCAIEIYNLSDQSLDLIDEEYIAAEFSAGYHDVGLAKLFSGQVIQKSTRKSGADRVTQIQMGTGYTDLNHTALSKLVAPGRTIKDVMEEIRKTMPGVSRGVYAGVNLNSSVIHGYPLIGNPKAILDNLSETYGIEYRVNDGVLYANDANGTIDENYNEAYVVGRDSGLIELPYRTSGDPLRTKKDKQKKEGVQWKMLLNPNIIPGTILKLEDDRLGGWYKVTEIRHYGSFRENDWYTDVYCDIKNT